MTWCSSRRRRAGCSRSIGGTGAVLHELQVGAPSIASPVVVDGVLILGDCLGRPVRLGRLRSVGRAAAAVEDAVRGVHRVDARGLAGVAVPRYARGIPLRHRRRRRTAEPSAPGFAQKNAGNSAAVLRRLPRRERERPHRERGETRDRDRACASSACPHPSATMPAASPATNPPRWARQSMTELRRRRAPGSGSGTAPTLADAPPPAPTRGAGSCTQTNAPTTPKIAPDAPTLTCTGSLANAYEAALAKSPVVRKISEEAPAPELAFDDRAEHPAVRRRSSTGAGCRRAGRSR